MQLLATGKWSKAEKRWNMVVALHSPQAEKKTPAKRRTKRDENCAPARVYRLKQRDA